MTKLNFEEYVEYYNTTKRLPFPQTTWSRKKPFTERELHLKYRDYESKIEKLESKRQNPTKSEYSEKVEIAMQKARELDSNYEVWNNYYRMLDKTSKEVIAKGMWVCPKNDKTNKVTFDSAHIFSRGEYPHLAYEIDNLVLIPRNYHTYIDNFQNPLTYEHERLTKEEHDKLWIDLIGIRRWNSLLEKSK